eukprot:9430490-Alexandrium_andersonii.AAC.1
MDGWAGGARRGRPPGKSGQPLRGSALLPPAPCADQGRQRGQPPGVGPDTALGAGGAPGQGQRPHGRGRRLP